MFVVLAIGLAVGMEKNELPPGAAAAMLLWAGGFLTSSILAAAALVKAIRSGMRVWIGEGVNQARTLLLGMLIVAFVPLVLGPMLVWLVGRLPRAGNASADVPFVLIMFTCMFAGPVLILVVLDWISRRVLADQPGKFGPKAPTVGKWNA
jgi:hypothetical protein